MALQTINNLACLLGGLKWSAATGLREQAAGQLLAIIGVVMLLATLSIAASVVVRRSAVSTSLWTCGMLGFTLAMAMIWLS